MTDAAPGASPGEPRYGWVVVWACFACLAIVFGAAYSFAAFFESFAREFEAQRADVSVVFGLSGLTYFLLGAGAGVLGDRFGPRAVSVAGMLCIAGGLFAASFAQSLHALYVAYGFGIGVGVALVYTPSIGAVQPWFSRRRGLASGIASAGIGAGTLVIPLVASFAIAAWGWRDAMRAIALLSLALGLAAALLLRRRPAAAGLDAAATGVSLSQAMRTSRFWWLYLSIAVSSVAMFTPFAHVTPSARDLGIAESQAVGLVGVIGIGSLVGRFVISALADRLGRLLTLIVLQLAMAAAYIVWQLAAGYAALFAFALLFGLAYGGIVALLPAIATDLFGHRAVSGIIGTLYSGAAFGNLLGPVGAGAAFDRFGSYAAVQWTCIAICALAAYAAARVAGGARIGVTVPGR